MRVVVALRVLHFGSTMDRERQAIDTFLDVLESTGVKFISVFEKRVMQVTSGVDDSNAAGGHRATRAS
jgi:hypothetical protein